MKRLSMSSSLVLLIATLLVPISAQSATSTSGSTTKIKGIILKQEGQGFRMRDQAGAEWSVSLASNAKIEEKKGNPFRGSKKYTVAQLVRGLYVEVEGHSDSSGTITANKIKFSDDALR